MEDRTLFTPPPAIRACGWCRGPMPTGSRSDALYCRTPCRQSAWRLGKGRALRLADGVSLRLAYADPPYPGKSFLYASHPDYAGEVDHRRLLRRLGAYDGWALSTSAEALPSLLAMAPEGTKVAAWLRGERPTTSYAPLNAWEPVLYHGGRAYLSSVDERRVDALSHVSRPRTSDPDRVVGAKPAAFCYWVFDLLGALPGDELTDMFPGSGGVMRCWAAFSSAPRRRELPEPPPELNPPELWDVAADG